MKPKASWLLLLLIVLINCCRESPKKNFDIPKDILGMNTRKQQLPRAERPSYTAAHGNAKGTTPISCDSLLTLLVQTSSLDKSEREGFQVQTDDVVKGVLKIKITSRNEVGVDVPIVWLDLDIKKKALTDVTPNHDKPIELRYDTTIFNMIVNNCKVVE